MTFVFTNLFKKWGRSNLIQNCLSLSLSCWLFNTFRHLSEATTMLQSAGWSEWGKKKLDVTKTNSLHTRTLTRTFSHSLKREEDLSCLELTICEKTSASTSRDPPPPWGYFHQRFLPSFYVCRSQKDKKTVNSTASFCTSGICAHKASRITLVKLTFGGPSSLSVKNLPFHEFLQHAHGPLNKSQS